MQARKSWLTRVLLLLMLAFAGLTGYSLYALNNLQEDISRDPGEDMVWAVQQALYQSNLLMLAQYAPASEHRSNPALQHALLRGRLKVLMAPAQESFMRYAGVYEPLQQIKQMLYSPNPDHRQIQITLHDIGQHVMRAKLDQSGERRDKHKALLDLLTLCISGVIAAGGLLCWQLLSSLYQVRKARDEAHHLLDELNREKQARLRYRDFVSLMSHQLRTPLAVIDSSAQRLIRESQESERIAERSSRIRSSVRQLNQLIARVLQGLKLDASQSNNIHLNYQRCDWQEVLSTTLNNFGDLLAERPIRQHWATHTVRPLWIECDRLWCEEIMVNLISNADKYSPANLPLDIFIESDGHTLQCVVCDSGTGLPEECLTELFEPFFRGKTSHNNDGGIGLGLSIARTLARAHGGDLRAENCQEKGGARFILSLPVHGSTSPSL